MKAFYPYGVDQKANPGAAAPLRLHPGAAEVVTGDGRRSRRIEDEVATPAPLEQTLRAEGHEVREVRGPVGTTEHVLLLKRG